jgi:hypothetical protein
VSVYGGRFVRGVYGDVFYHQVGHVSLRRLQLAFRMQKVCERGKEFGVTDWVLVVHSFVVHSLGVAGVLVLFNFESSD